MEHYEATIQQLLDIIEELRRENTELKKIITQQNARIAELEKRLGLDSTNSSKPSSSDGFKKKLRTKSLRINGKNASGGQTGHKGTTLNQAAKPDRVIVHTITTCPHCNSHLAEKILGRIKRQVFDIPPTIIEVTEHQAEIKMCLNCQCKVQAEFPKGVNAPVQYGARIKALTVYLNEQHFVPEDRLQVLFKEVYKAQIATATLVKFCNDLSENLVMEDVKGIIVHDDWKPYLTMEGVEHGKCHAHHLRELNALIEYEKEKWAKKMRRLLLFMNTYRNLYDGKIPTEKIVRLEKIYDEVVDEGLKYHEEFRESLLRGRIPISKKKQAGHNLPLRLKNYRENALRFLHNPIVPFTNNQAEQDLRMMKVRQKISGGFRTVEGALVFIRIRTFISTARKQGWDVFQSMAQAIVGDVPILTV